jgi:hypothetical protein
MFSLYFTEMSLNLNNHLGLGLAEWAASFTALWSWAVWRPSTESTGVGFWRQMDKFIDFLVQAT